MSRGPGTIERRIGQLFASTKDRALSVGDLARHAYGLDGTTPNRKQRLAATRAAHRLLRRAAEQIEAVRAPFEQAVAEATAVLGRGSRARRWGGDSVLVNVGGRLRGPFDPQFAEAMTSRPCWNAYRRAAASIRRERKRFGDALHRDGGWRATETEDRRLWFHPADYPVRVWAVSIEPEGVAWADAEIVSITASNVNVRYRGEPARLSREKLARAWTLYRNVFFTSTRSGYAARSFERMWRERDWRPGTAPPPAMQMPLADAIELLGVPADFTREDIITAFRRAALRCHPDHGGTEAQFIKLVEARDRLLASLGTKERAPRMPEFAPKGVKLRYGAWRPESSHQRLGHTRRLARG